MTPPDQNRSRFRNRHSDNRKPAHRCGSNEIDGERGRVLDRGTMAKHPRYLELAWQAKVVGDEVAVQHNLQHAEHWDRTSMAGRQAGDMPPARISEKILAD
jgi:hypothetical protein